MEYISNLYKSDNGLINEAIEKLVIEINRFKGQGEKKFLLTGCGAQSGTTSTSISLAIDLSLCGWKTLLIDCDFRKGNTYKRLNENTKYGLADFLSIGQKQIKEEDIIYGTNYGGLDYLPSGNVTGMPASLLCSRRLESFIKSLEQIYDCIVFDCPSLNIVSDACAFFPLVDRVLLVTRLEYATKRQLHSARIKIKGYKKLQYGIIVNGVNMKEFKRNIKDYSYLMAPQITKRYKEATKKKRKEVV